MLGAYLGGTLSGAFGGDYLSVFVETPIVLVGLIFIAVVALVNFRGISESVRLNVLFTTIELIGLLLVVLIGLAAIGDGRPASTPDARSTSRRARPSWPRSWVARGWRSSP